MPYASLKQLRYMHAKHPRIARRWDAEIGKGLPRALADIPLKGEISNPLVATRVMAHDRGKAAGKVIAGTKDFERRWAQRYPERKGSLVAKPLNSLLNTERRWEGQKTVRAGQDAAERIKNQGRWAREQSRSVGKASTAEEKRKNAAVGAGAVGVGAGFLGGGVPGTKATRLTADVMRAPLHKKPVELARARVAGAMGLRHTGHKILVDAVLKPKREAIKGTDATSNYLRGLHTGKIESEQKIIRHLNVGRVGSNALLAGGAGTLAYGLHRKKKKAEVAKRDTDRRDAALVGGGGSLAAGSTAVGLGLKHQGRKWSSHSSASLTEAGKIVPEAGAHKVRRTWHGVPSVSPTMPGKNINEGVLHGKTGAQAERLGHLRGQAGQAKYFANVYGQFGGALRRGVAPAGLAAAAVGGASLHKKKQRQSLADVKKAYRPTYFGGSAPTERTQAQHQRTRTELQHQGAKAAAVGLGGASTAALGARFLGHKSAPALISTAGKYANVKGVPGDVVGGATSSAHRAHKWAANKRGRLLVAGGALGGASVGARALSRWKRDEATGISQDLGRASAGDLAQRHSRRVEKGILTALGVEAGARSTKKYAELSPAARKRLALGVTAGTVGGAGTAGSLWAGHRARKLKRENDQLKAAGGLAGPVMKSETVGFGKSNVRQYAHLPENIREQVGYGSIGPRRNPMSPLDLFASSRIMAQTSARARGETVRGHRLSRRAGNEAAYAGSRAMLYSPAGRGSMF
jgi:hypothetical protein